MPNSLAAETARPEPGGQELLKENSILVLLQRLRYASAWPWTGPRGWGASRRGQGGSPAEWGAGSPWGLGCGVAGAPCPRGRALGRHHSREHSLQAPGWICPRGLLGPWCRAMGVLGSTWVLCRAASCPPARSACPPSVVLAHHPLVCQAAACRHSGAKGLTVPLTPVWVMPGSGASSWAFLPGGVGGPLYPEKIPRDGCGTSVSLST